MSRMSLAFTPDAMNVRHARDFAARAAAAQGRAQHEWLVRQIVSELATNAVLHARTRFTVAVAGIDSGIRVEVTDDSPAVPRQRSYSDDATTGRGLHLVQQWATRWGIDVGDGGSKTIWAEIDSAPASTPDDEEMARR